MMKTVYVCQGYLPRKSAGYQRGYILIISIILLLIVTMVTIAMGRGFFADEAMAGNMREKIRSFTAAQSALKYAENYVSAASKFNKILLTPTPCVAGARPIAVCANPNLQNLINSVVINPPNSATPVQTYSIYAMPGMTVSTSGGTDTYYSYPLIYLTNLPPSTINGSLRYGITAVGYGGSSTDVSILQSSVEIDVIPPNTSSCSTSPCNNSPNPTTSSGSGSGAGGAVNLGL